MILIKHLSTLPNKTEAITLRPLVTRLTCIASFFIWTYDRSMENVQSMILIEL